MNIDEAIAQAYRHWAAREIDQADRLCRQILAEAPAHVAALHLLGTIADAAGNGAAAADLLERAAASPAASATIHDDLAEVYRRLGRLDAAEAAARRALALDERRAHTWHRLALILLAAGRIDDSRLPLERAVALDPAAADAHNNLGIVLQRLGEIERAHQQYAAAVALNPRDPGAYGNLAAALAELGRHHEALAAAEQAIALDPTLVGPHVYAALAEASLGHHDSALRRLDRALELAPDSVPVLTARAEALRQLDRAEEGLVSCRRAIALQPDNGEAHNTLGLLLHRVNRDDEALVAFDRAIARLPQPGVAIANKAVMLMQLGRRAEASAAVELALAREPDLAAAWYTRADTRKFARGDADIAAMEQILRESDAPPARRRRRSDGDRLLLHYALGKAYLDIEDAERAFFHLDAGNRLKRSLIAYDADATAESLAAIAAAFSSERIAALSGAGEPSDVPVFVIGMPRSGTTLVEQILASHPDVYGAGEPRHLERIAQGVSPYPAGLATLPRDRLAALGREYLALVRPEAPSAARIVDKMPSNFLYAGLIHLILPRARIIHCRRDPVDTCLSCYSKLFTTGQEFSYDLVELGRYYGGYETLMAHWRAVLPPASFMEIVYEDLVGDLETEARRLVSFCGLDWHEGCLRFHETDRAIRSASMNQVRQPLYRGSIGRWKAFAAQLRPLIEALQRGAP